MKIEGLTKRDYFLATAINGILAREDWAYDTDPGIEDLLREASLIADAALKNSDTHKPRQASDLDL